MRWKWVVGIGVFLIIALMVVVYVLLETDPSGRGNWDLIAGDSADKRARSYKTNQIEINDIRIENLSLTLRDGKTGSARRLTLISFGVARQDTADMLAIDLRAEYSGQPVTLSGKTGSNHDLLAHQRFPLILSGKFSNAAVMIDGAIEDVLNLHGIDLRTRVSGTNLDELSLNLGIKLLKTNAFEVTGHLMGSRQSITFKEVSGNLSASGVDIAISGIISDLIAIGNVDLKLKASGKDLAEFGPIIGEKLPATGEFTFQGRLSGSSKAITLKNSQGRVERGSLRLSLDGSIKNLMVTVRLESSVIDFTTFMRMAEKDKQELGEADKRERRLFPEDPLPFDALKKMDADIAVKARNIRVRDAQLEFGHLTLTLEDSNLSIDNLEATYKQTKISGNLHLDSGSPPQVATKFLVQNFDLGNLLKEAGVNDQVRAVVDIAAHGKSRGDSVQSLMANLDGSVGAVMGQGFLSKYLDLLSMNLSQLVIPIWGSHKKAGEINCAVVQFDIKKGVATSQAFVFDTQIGVLTAEGDINLGTELVNFLLDPKPNLLPTVRPDTLSLATKSAKFLGHLALGPVGLLAPFAHLGAHKKHPCDIQSIGQLGL